MGVPDLDTVFSQARNGRTKRLEESLNLGKAVENVPTCALSAVVIVVILIYRRISY